MTITAHSVTQHLTPSDLAERIGIPLQTIYRWRSEGKGPRGFRAGKYVRFRLEDVEAWEQEQLDKDSA
ncbi:helix-turn-helix transcriptional regulator [Micrococcus terreus]|uniref:helix-turn-helix transcriptional regulator n=1 Tax=Micrococcus terreus TaxID=574650 RepID=UPI002549D038|nr:helix-turn-helix domain-containing protein [Micrococcus terreus]MDK7701185.1 helix-turn-helix domain-containing protein [Micrococcus terreus]WOO97806.1 helix-turn-helix domain-containing protein [Micrococcus terreus]